jgi:hypothetical protein
MDQTRLGINDINRLNDIQSGPLVIDAEESGGIIAGIGFIQADGQSIRSIGSRSVSIDSGCKTGGKVRKS